MVPPRIDRSRQAGIRRQICEHHTRRVLPVTILGLDRHLQSTHLGIVEAPVAMAMFLARQILTGSMILLAQSQWIVMETSRQPHPPGVLE